MSEEEKADIVVIDPGSTIPEMITVKKSDMESMLLERKSDKLTIQQYEKMESAIAGMLEKLGPALTDKKGNVSTMKVVKFITSTFSGKDGVKSIADALGVSEIIAIKNEIQESREKALNP